MVKIAVQTHQLSLFLASFHLPGSHGGGRVEGMQSREGGMGRQGGRTVSGNRTQQHGPECAFPKAPGRVDQGKQQGRDGAQGVGDEKETVGAHAVDEEACGDVDDDAEDDVGEEADGGGEDGEVLDSLEAG